MKKLRYIPGMFSIILLPLLGYIYFQSNGYFTQLTAVVFDHMLADELIFEDFEDYRLYEFDKRIYTEITLNGNKKESKETFQYIDNFVNKVIHTKDTVNGLKIHFGKNSTYNEFVQLLNIFQKNETRLFRLKNNTMYFIEIDWSALNKKTFEEIDCEGPPIEYISDEQIAKIKKVFDDNNKGSVSQQIFDNLKTQFLQNKIIYSAYFIFVFVTLTYLIKRKST